MRDDLEKLIEDARARGPMTDEELRAQRQSWVRGEMALGLDRDEVDWRKQRDK